MALLTREANTGHLNGIGISGEDAKEVTEHDVRIWKYRMEKNRGSPLTKGRRNLLVYDVVQISSRFSQSLRSWKIWSRWKNRSTLPWSKL